jgi:hypothetical protein
MRLNRAAIFYQEGTVLPNAPFIDPLNQRARPLPATMRGFQTKAGP